MHKELLILHSTYKKKIPIIFLIVKLLSKLSKKKDFFVFELLKRLTDSTLDQYAPTFGQNTVVDNIFFV